MENQVTCKKCESTQVTVQKVGFNIKKSLAGFLFMLVLICIIWAGLISNQNFENNRIHQISQADYTPINYTGNGIFWAATFFLLASSFLFGLYRANENQIVCLKCGHTHPIGEHK